MDNRRMQEFFSSVSSFASALEGHVESFQQKANNAEAYDTALNGAVSQEEIDAAREALRKAGEETRRKLEAEGETDLSVLEDAEDLDEYKVMSQLSELEADMRYAGISESDFGQNPVWANLKSLEHYANILTDAENFNKPIENESTRNQVNGLLKEENKGIKAEAREIDALLREQTTLMTTMKSYMDMIKTQIKEYTDEYKRLKLKVDKEGKDKYKGTSYAKEVIENYKKVAALQTQLDALNNYSKVLRDIKSTWKKGKDVDALNAIVGIAKNYVSDGKELVPAFNGTIVNIEDLGEQKRINVTINGQKVSPITVSNEMFTPELVSAVVRTATNKIIEKNVGKNKVNIDLGNGEVIATTVSGIATSLIGKIKVAEEVTPSEITAEEVTPVEETPEEEITTEEVNPVEETPVEETPVEETPVEETPVEETPVEETPVEETPVEENEEERELDEEATLKKYHDMGYDENEFGFYQNPETHEYDPDYNPLEDSRFQVFKEKENVETPVEETPVEETPVEVEEEEEEITPVEVEHTPATKEKPEGAMKVVKSRVSKFAKGAVKHPFILSAIATVGFGVFGQYGLAAASLGAGVVYGGVKAVKAIATAAKKWAVEHKLRKIGKKYDLKLDTSSDVAKYYVMDEDGNRVEMDSIESDDDIIECQDELEEAFNSDEISVKDLSAAYEKHGLPKLSLRGLRDRLKAVGQGFVDLMTVKAPEDDEEEMEPVDYVDPVEVEEVEEVEEIAPEVAVELPEGRHYSDDQLLSFIAQVNKTGDARQPLVDLFESQGLKDSTEITDQHRFTEADIEYLRNGINDELIEGLENVIDRLGLKAQGRHL